MNDARTILVLGDQLNRAIGALATARPALDHILIVETEEKIRSQRWHRQRLHFYLSSMRHFAEELRDAGFTVDYVRTASMRAAITAASADGSRIVATEPNSFGSRRLLTELGVELVRSDQFLLHHGQFAGWVDERRAKGYKTFKLDRKSTRLNSSHVSESRMPSSA